MKQGFQLKFSQNLSLTPQLQQAIRLLQLSSLELNQEIDVLMQTNPLLERDETGEDEYGDASEVGADDTASAQTTQEPHSESLNAEASESYTDANQSSESNQQNEVAEFDANQTSTQNMRPNLTMSLMSFPMAVAGMKIVRHLMTTATLSNKKHCPPACANISYPN